MALGTRFIGGAFALGTSAREHMPEPMFYFCNVLNIKVTVVLDRT